MLGGGFGLERDRQSAFAVALNLNHLGLEVPTAFLSAQLAARTGALLTAFQIVDAFQTGSISAGHRWLIVTTVGTWSRVRGRSIQYRAMAPASTKLRETRTDAMI